MSNKVWIEVAMNGAWTRVLQPNIPITAEEISREGIDCINAGAAIIHAHSLDPETGKQNSDVDICQGFIEGIQSKVDAIVYPSSIDFPMSDDPDVRNATSNELCRRGALEWGILDPGSCNFSTKEGAANLFGDDGDIYTNGPVVLKGSAKLAAEYGWRPAYACYEPGFIREGAMLYRSIPNVKMPVFRFMLSDSFTFCFPPREWAIEALAMLMAEEAPDAPWMVAGLDINTIPLIPKIVELGGHVRVGLEDAPFQNEKTNVQWVEEAVQAIRDAGGEPATAAEVRLSLEQKPGLPAN